MRYIFTSILAFVFTIASSQAQSLSLGAGMHHNLNGIHLLYSTNKSMDAQWQWNIGLRIAVNTYAWQRNYQNHSEYQTGYAMNFGEHFALTSNVSRKLAGGKHKWRIDAIMGATLSRNSKLKKIWHHGYNQDGIFIWSDTYDVYQADPNTYFELGLGLKFAYKINDQLQAYASGMVGVFIGPMNEYGNVYYHDGANGRYWSTGPDVISGIGMWNMVGFEGLPILSVGLRYQLNTRNKEKLSTVK